MMKKIKDPNTGVIKYIPDDNDISLLKLSREIKRIDKKISDLESRINKLESRDI